MKTTAIAGLLLGTVLAAPGWAEEGSFSSSRVIFAQGRRAFDLGEIEEAAALFLQSSGFDPSYGDSLHWLGLAYLRLGRPADAAARFEESLQAKEPPSAGSRRVRSDLRLAREAVAKGSTSPIEVEPPAFEPDLPLFGDLPSWDIRAGLETLHDSNPGLLPEDLNVPGNPFVQGASPDDGARLDLRLEHHPFYRRRWNLGLSLLGQQSMYQDQSDLDLSLLQGTVSLAWGGSRTGTVSGPLGSTRVPVAYDRISLLVQGGGAGVWLDGDAYLGLAEAAASLTARESTATATRVDLEAHHSSYEDDAQDALQRGGTEVLAGVSQFLFLGGDDSRYVRLGFIAGQRRAGSAFDSSSSEALAEIAAPLAGRWTLSAFGSWRADRFDHAESSLGFGGTKREDTTWRINLAAAYSLNDHLRWIVRGSHLRRDSNVLIGQISPLFDYERTTFSLGLDWRP